MTTLQSFRHYRISQDRKGGTVELWRSGDEVVCLTMDTLRQAFTELHVVIAPPEVQRDARSFLQIVQLAATLRHRHLLGVLDGGEDEGANYYMAELLDGERLDTWLARCNPVPPWLALQIAAQLVEGLAVLAQHPRLLAGVDLFNSGLTLAGDSPDDLTARICDLGLPRRTPAGMDARHAEARAIEQTGRLLLYMLTGQVQDGPADQLDLGNRVIAPELGFLLGTIFLPAMQHHPRTIEQLRTLLDRCMRELSPELAARPERLAPALRPRLPLQSEFLSPAALAEAVGEDFTVDARPFDAADPYRFRATHRDTRKPVSIQVLPPDRLLPHDWTRWISQAAKTIIPAEYPNLLRVLAWEGERHPEILVEESASRYSLHSLVKVRGQLTAEETAMVLEQIESAVLQAESCSLNAQIRSPRHIAVRFTGPAGDDALPPESQLAVLPLDQWPPFRLCVRTWPVTLHFTQPERFNAERLIQRDPANPESAARQSGFAVPVNGRDFALLAAWMMGGTGEVPEKVRTLIYDHLGNRSEAALGGRREFLDRFKARLGRPSPAAPSGGSRSRGRKKAQRQPAGPADIAETAAAALAPVRADARPAVHPVTSPDPAPPPAEPAPSFPFGYETGPVPEEGPAPGLAEMLFGAAPPAADYNAPAAERHPLFAAPEYDSPGSRDHTTLDGPVGVFGSAPWSETDPLTEPPRTNRVLFVLLLMLIAALLAAVAAHVSGYAAWR